MSEKKFSPMDVILEIKKSLTQTLMKADPVLRSILMDLSDKNSIAEIPKKSIPTHSENVLNKIDGTQQQGIKPPSLKNNVPPNYNAMKLQMQAPKTPAGMGGGQGPKKPKGLISIGSKLQGFMQKMEEKRNMGKTNSLMEKGSIAKLRQEMAESQGVKPNAQGLVPNVKPNFTIGHKIDSEPKSTILPFKVPKISLPKDPKPGV